jgi:hypothetical protein
MTMVEVLRVTLTWLAGALDLLEFLLDALVGGA